MLKSKINLSLTGGQTFLFLHFQQIRRLLAVVSLDFSGADGIGMGMGMGMGMEVEKTKTPRTVSEC